MCSFDVQVLQSLDMLGFHALGIEVNEEINENVAKGNKK